MIFEKIKNGLKEKKIAGLCIFVFFLILGIIIPFSYDYYITLNEPLKTILSILILTVYSYLLLVILALPILLIKNSKFTATLKKFKEINKQYFKEKKLLFISIYIFSAFLIGFSYITILILNRNIDTLLNLLLLFILGFSFYPLVSIIFLQFENQKK